MPVKKHKTHHRPHGEKHKRSKHFLKVYAPYIPILLVVGVGLLLSDVGWHQKDSAVLSYANDVSKQNLLKYTNLERAKKDRTGLNIDDELTRAAQLKANDMAAKDYWSHKTPDGKEPWFFLQKAGYEYSVAAENLAYGFDTSDSTVSGWMNSPAHKANMLDDSIAEVGFGIANAPNYQEKGQQTLVVAMYALPAQPDSPATQKVLPAQEEKISLMQSITGGQAPWSSLVIGLFIGAAGMYLLVKHLRTLRRALISSEKFIIRHPVLDTTLVALIVLAAILNQTTGVIH